MNKKNLCIGLLLCFLFVWTGSAFAAGPVKQRQNRQQQRIEQGVRNGTLTHAELKRLNREQHRIAQFKRKAMQDHRITRHEARRIHNLQEQANRHIYQYKHNRAKQQRVARYHHQDYRTHAKPRKHCRVDRYPVNSISGILAQPGLSLAWNVALD